MEFLEVVIGCLEVVICGLEAVMECLEVVITDILSADFTDNL